MGPVLIRIDKSGLATLVMPQVVGRADGKRVSAAVKEKLTA